MGPDYENIKNVVWFVYYLTQWNARRIYDIWQTNKALRDYKRPSITTLRKWISGFEADEQATTAPIPEQV